MTSDATALAWAHGMGDGPMDVTTTYSCGTGWLSPCEQLERAKDELGRASNCYAYGLYTGRRRDRRDPEIADQLDRIAETLTSIAAQLR